MPGRWLPCPGKRSADLARAPSVVGRGTSPAFGRVLTRRRPGAAARVSSSVESATSAIRTPRRHGAATDSCAPCGGEREVPQPPRLVRPGPPRRRRAARATAVGRASVRAAEGEQLGRPLRRARAAGGGPSVVRAQHDVEVGAAEAEGADPGDPLGRRRRPRAGRRCGRRTGCSRASQAGFGSVRCRVGGLTPVCRASAVLISPASPAAHLVCPICDLTEPSAQLPGCGTGVARTPRSGCRARCGRRRRCRCRAPRPGRPRRARCRRCGRPASSALRWPSGRGAVRPERPAVAGAADPLDHRVHPVAVALGVGEPLEHDAADALAERDAVGGAVEGGGPAGRRERVHGGEEQVVVDAVVQVGAAAQHQVAGAARPVPCRPRRPRSARRRRRRRRCSWRRRGRAGWRSGRR